MYVRNQRDDIFKVDKKVKNTFITPTFVTIIITNIENVIRHMDFGKDVKIEHKNQKMHSKIELIRN